MFTRMFALAYTIQRRSKIDADNFINCRHQSINVIEIFFITYSDKVNQALLIAVNENYF